MAGRVEAGPESTIPPSGDHRFHVLWTADRSRIFVCSPGSARYCFPPRFRGRSSSVERELPKLERRVRFPPPAILTGAEKPYVRRNRASGKQRRTVQPLKFANLLLQVVSDFARRAIDVFARRIIKLRSTALSIGPTCGAKNQDRFHSRVRKIEDAHFGFKL